MIQITIMVPRCSFSPLVLPFIRAFCLNLFVFRIQRNDLISWTFSNSMVLGKHRRTSDSGCHCCTAGLLSFSLGLPLLFPCRYIFQRTIFGQRLTEFALRISIWAAEGFRQTAKSKMTVTAIAFTTVFMKSTGVPFFEGQKKRREAERHYVSVDANYPFCCADAFWSISLHRPDRMEMVQCECHRDTDNFSDCNTGEWQNYPPSVSEDDSMTHRVYFLRAKGELIISKEPRAAGSERTLPSTKEQIESSQQSLVCWHEWPRSWQRFDRSTSTVADGFVEISDA